MFMEVYLRKTYEDICLEVYLRKTCSTRLYLEGKGPHGSCGRQRNRLGEETREDTACADRRNPALIGATALFARNRVLYE